MTYNEYKLRAIKEIAEIVTGFKLDSLKRNESITKVLVANLCVFEMDMKPVEIAEIFKIKRSVIYHYKKTHNNEFEKLYHSFYNKCAETLKEVSDDYNITDEVKQILN